MVKFQSRNEFKAPGMLRIGDSRDIPVLEFELEKEDVMKFKPLYEALHQFLAEEGFTHPQTKDDRIEDLYWERWIPSGAKEQHVWWRVHKEINPYVRYFVAIHQQTLNVTKAEVAYKTKKVNAERIDYIIRIKFWLQWDYHNKFENSLAWKMKRIFLNQIYDAELKQRKKDLEDFGMRMKALIKYYFEMTAERDYPVQLHPPMGYKEP